MGWYNLYWISFIYVLSTETKQEKNDICVTLLRYVKFITTVNSILSVEKKFLVNFSEKPLLFSIFIMFANS